jgi:hypothetical protein
MEVATAHSQPPPAPATKPWSARLYRFMPIQAFAAGMPSLEEKDTLAPLVSAAAGKPGRRVGWAAAGCSVR